MPSLTRLAPACLAVLALALPAAAHASSTQQSMMMDDDNLLYNGDQVRDQTLDKMKQVGVDTVRVTVLWSVVADKALSTPARRKRFDARNPRTYPPLNWDRYDRLVRSAYARGMGVYFNVTPPAPSWAREKAPRGLRTAVKNAWKPKPNEFAKFVEAVGRRFSGRYRDENDGRQIIPKVTTWSLLNEPNQAGWLAPQWEKGKMASAVMARELFLRGRAALDRTGHGKDTIFFGETAPLGSAKHGQRSPVYPKTWLKAFLCSNPHGPGCNLFDKYGPIRATAYAHHPYTKNVAPTVRNKSGNAITLANIGDLGTLLDQLARKTKNVRTGLPIELTEFGFETNPPDPFSGVPLDKQALWNMQGEFLAFQNPRVAGITQFLLKDVPPVAGKPANSKAHWFTYQSGIEFVNGAPKPSFTGYYFPFLVNYASGQLNVWGQLKFRPNNLPPGAQDSVQLQYSSDGGQTWTDTGAPIPVTNGMGFFVGSIPSPGPGLVRAAFPNSPVASLPQPS